MKTLVRFVIRGYQILVSPLLHAVGGAGCGCRFHPSCSKYCLEAVEAHGVWRGGFLGLKRLSRCHPWGGQGLDPVPGILKGGRSPHLVVQESREIRN